MALVSSRLFKARGFAPPSREKGKVKSKLKKNADSVSNYFINVNQLRKYTSWQGCLNGFDLRK